jgi:hypothetical protein
MKHKSKFTFEHQVGVTLSIFAMLWQQQANKQWALFQVHQRLNCLVKRNRSELGEMNNYYCKGKVQKGGNKMETHSWFV